MIQVNGEDSASITFDPSADHFDTQEAVVDNIYVKIPDGFYMERQLNIEKKVLKDGVATTSDQTFYATVNEVDPTTGEETTVITTELKQNDTVTVLFQVADISDKDVVLVFH